MSIKALIIAEDRGQRRELRSALEARGCVVAEAARGDIGVELAKRFAPSVILLHLALPDLAGAVVLEELKREVLTAQVPIITLSPLGDPPAPDVSRFAAAHLMMPVASQRLLATVQGVLIPSPRTGEAA